MNRFSATLIAALVFALLTTACFSSSTGPSTSSADGRVVGTLRIVGGPPPGDLRPEPNDSFQVVSGTQAIRSVKADGNGRFSFSLPAGSYGLTMGPNTPITPRILRVVAGVTIHLPLTIQAK
jgi:hypothetical protein